MQQETKNKIDELDSKQLNFLKLIKLDIKSLLDDIGKLGHPQPPQHGVSATSR